MLPNGGGGGGGVRDVSRKKSGGSVALMHVVSGGRRNDVGRLASDFTQDYRSVRDEYSQTVIDQPRAGENTMDLMHYERSYHDNDIEYIAARRHSSEPYRTRCESLANENRTAHSRHASSPDNRSVDMTFASDATTFMRRPLAAHLPVTSHASSRSPRIGGRHIISQRIRTFGLYLSRRKSYHRPAHRGAVVIKTLAVV